MTKTPVRVTATVTGRSRNGRLNSPLEKARSMAFDASSASARPRPSRASSLCCAVMSAETSRIVSPSALSVPSSRRRSITAGVAVLNRMAAASTPPKNNHHRAARVGRAASAS
jgi:hypothetical protein